jgi:tetratricopeptide (TPR) repeat protein
MKNLIMTLCLIITVGFIWVWHHQTQFNDHSRQAMFHTKNGELDEAAEAYTKAIRYKKKTLFFGEEPSVYNNLGQVYLSKGEYDKAVETFKRTIELKPDAVQAYINLATAYLKQNQLDFAIASSQKAIQIAPNTALAWYNLACAHALKGENDPAIDALQKAIDIDARVKAFARGEQAFDGLSSHPVFDSE